MKQYHFYFTFIVQNWFPAVDGKTTAADDSCRHPQSFLYANGRACGFAAKNSLFAHAPLNNRCSDHPRETKIWFRLLFSYTRPFDLFKPRGFLCTYTSKKSQWKSVPARNSELSRFLISAAAAGDMQNKQTQNFTHWLHPAAENFFDGGDPELRGRNNYLWWINLIFMANSSCLLQSRETLIWHSGKATVLV